MTPRPRTVSDGEILAATARVIGRVGPQRLTLAEVGAEVGLAAATVVQRFGSKRELLLAFARCGPGTDSEPAPVPVRSASPLRTLVDMMAGMGEMARTPEEMSNHLAFLQMDLSDAEFHALTASHFRTSLGQIEGLLDGAVLAGELGPTDTAQLARAVQSMANGALLNWAIHREGSAVDAIRTDLDVLLGPYQAQSRRSRGAAGSRRSR